MHKLNDLHHAYILLKNLKEPDPQVNNHALIQNAPVGAVTVLPYFGVKKDESSEIDQSTFVSKAKAALYYYQHNVNKSINSIYYIGDEIKESYDNNEGASLQKNAAHFVELAAAMSIVDFSKTDEAQLQNGLNGIPIISKSLEFGVKTDSDPLSFSDLGDSSKSLLTRSLTQFLLFHKFSSDFFPNNLEQAAWRSGTEIKGDFLSGDFYSGNLKRFRVYFEQWLKELSGNRRSFNPFNLEVDAKHIFDIVNGYKPKTRMFESGSNYSRIQHHANHAENNMANLSPENKYVSVMYQATKKTVEEKYNF